METNIISCTRMKKPNVPSTREVDELIADIESLTSSPPYIMLKYIKMMIISTSDINYHLSLNPPIEIMEVPIESCPYTQTPNLKPSFENVGILIENCPYAQTPKKGVKNEKGNKN